MQLVSGAFRYGFNSRAHEGRDADQMSRLSADGVSIHAPTKGATGYDKINAGDRLVSIHAPTKGATAAYRVQFTDTMFQFTRPRRARQPFTKRITLTCSFNSRAHEGRDLIITCLFDTNCVSIHAPTKGATWASEGAAPTRLFQFTRPRRARL